MSTRRSYVCSTIEANTESGLCTLYIIQYALLDQVIFIKSVLLCVEAFNLCFMLFCWTDIGKYYAVVLHLILF